MVSRTLRHILTLGLSENSAGVKRKVIKYLQRKGLLAGSMKCKVCRRRMKMVPHSGKDGYIW